MMKIQIGCLARFFNRYEDEVQFAKLHGFDLMQIWYDRNGIALQKDPFPKENVIQKMKFPAIIHAVLDVNEFEEHIPKLIEILLFLEHKELIIHPICDSEEITAATIHKLSQKAAYALGMLSAHDITLYLENNSRLEPFFHTPEEIGIIFEDNPKLEFLLDVAHMESYEHLERIVAVKMPKALHIADKHFDVIHEHLPVGHGDIDFDYVFRNPLKAFTGKIVLEVIQSDEAVLSSRERIRSSVSGGRQSE